MSKPSFYVGVGASAGGLEALEAFFKAMPLKTEMAFMVVQHLSPDYKSLMDELLARHTSLKIQVVEGGESVEADTIYLLPPRKNLLIKDGVLVLEDQKPQEYLKLPIDIFFRSLAQDQEKRAIAVVLSGTGSDGTLGVRAIKELGGMVMVQEPQNARFDGMPRSSISTGLVDYVTPAQEMASVLMEYKRHMLSGDPQGTDFSAITPGIDDMTRIAMVLKNHCGVDISQYKESTVYRRLDRRVKVNRCVDIKAYLQLLQEDDKERDSLLKELLIGVTAFMRDTEAYESLERHALPNLDYTKEQIRIWSAGCSTGEEVYSIAMLISDYMERHGHVCDVKIFATDIDTKALEMASSGYYIDSLVGDLTKEMLQRHFTKRSEGYVISEHIRKMVVFARHNVLKDPPFSKLDLLVCRNLFIYLKPEFQQVVLSNFFYALSPRGYLFMGSSESVGDLAPAYQVVDSKWKIFRVKEDYKPDYQLAQNQVIYRGRGSGLQGTLIPSDSKSPLGNSKGNHLHNSVLHSTDQDHYPQAPLRIEYLLMEALSTTLAPSVIIDKNDAIIQVIGDAGAYIKTQPGRFSNNLNANMPRNLALYVNNLLRRLRGGEKEVLVKHFQMSEDPAQAIDLLGRTLAMSRSEFYLVSFVKRTIDASTQSTGDEKASTRLEIDLSQDMQDRMKQLELELQLAREGHQATIEELETSNEELQSSNEELIASNEELQSTNEELQSVNEELYTVNSEYQSKIDELTKLNNDLNNLIRNTEVGALYLDSKLHIRKLTPIVSRVTNILEGDMGRPIQHLSVMENYPNIVSDIYSVMDNLMGIDREIQDKEGHIWLTRIRPYRTAYYAIDGIIVTFVDITDLKKAKAERNKNTHRLEQALHMGAMAWWEYDLVSGQVNYSAGKATLIGYTPEEFPKDVAGICALIHPEDYDQTMAAMRRYLEGEVSAWDVIYRIKCKDGTYKSYHDLGYITERDSHGKPTRMVGTVQLVKG